MSVNLSPILQEAQLDNNGFLAAGWKIYTSAFPGGDPQATYTTVVGDVAQANPIVLNARGEPDQPLWLLSGLAYILELRNASDVLIKSWGPITGINDVTTTATEWIASVLTPTFITNNSFSLPGDQTSIFEINRRVKTVNTAGIIYGFIITATYAEDLTTIALSPDTGVLDSGLSSVSYASLSATNHSIPNVPRLFNAVNDVINGRFRIAQLGTSFTAPATGAYDLDGWQILYTNAAVVNIIQGSSTTTFTRLMTVTTPDTTVGAGDQMTQVTKLEGYNAVKYINTSFSIGFRVRSSVVGVHCVAVFNGTSTYVAEYVIHTANTWEDQVVTILGGTPVINDYTTTYGLAIRFVNACGSTWQTTPGAWQTGDFKGSASQVNDVATFGNVFGLRDVKINLGTFVSTSDDSYQVDLLRCQRQVEKSFSVNTTPAQGIGIDTGEYTFSCPAAGSANIRSSTVSFKVPKRGTPVVTLYNPAAANAEVRNISLSGDCSSSTTGNSCDNGFFITSVGNGSGALGNRLGVHWTAVSRL